MSKKDADAFLAELSALTPGDLVDIAYTLAASRRLRGLLTKEEEDALVEEVNSSNTDIFWIGISTPKQLYFMDHIRDRLNCRIICPVGYAFDVNAGVEARLEKVYKRLDEAFAENEYS